MSAILEMTAEKFQAVFIDSVPQYRALGLRVAERGLGYLAYDMPWAAGLVGDPETGEVHEFAVATLIDAVCATAIQTRLDRHFRTATLDLRVDFMRPGAAGVTLRGVARVVRLDADTALVQAVAHEGDEADPVALAAASFAVIGVRRA